MHFSEFIFQVIFKYLYLPNNKNNNKKKILLFILKFDISKRHLIILKQIKSEIIIYISHKENWSLL